MTEQEAYGQAFENGRKLGYEEGKRDAVKRGCWVRSVFREDYFHCSECGENREGKANYCHNCGADMRGNGNG